MLLRSVLTQWWGQISEPFLSMTPITTETSTTMERHIDDAQSNRIEIEHTQSTDKQSVGGEVDVLRVIDCYSIIRF